jgi:(4S)-4-hydroxy-5-phosphonooxypentane-2,3-dione isomerase
VVAALHRLVLKGSGMQVLVVDFRIKPEWVAAFAEAIVANARASVEREPGCRQFDVCRDPLDPALFFLYELYDDEAAVQAHLQSAHFLQMNELTAGWVEAKSVRRLLLG